MKKIVFFIILISSLLIINNLMTSIISLWKKNELVIKAQKDLEKSKNENSSLKQQLSEVQKNEFIERQARDKLFLVKPGEHIIILPEKKVEKSANVKKESIPNWKLWLNLFLDPK